MPFTHFKLQRILLLLLQDYLCNGSLNFIISKALPVTQSSLIWAYQEHLNLNLYSVKENKTFKCCDHMEHSLYFKIVSTFILIFFSLLRQYQTLDYKQITLYKNCFKSEEIYYYDSTTTLVFIKGDCVAKKRKCLHSLNHVLFFHIIKCISVEIPYWPVKFQVNWKITISAFMKLKDKPDSLK